MKSSLIGFKLDLLQLDEIFNKEILHSNVLPGKAPSSSMWSTSLVGRNIYQTLAAMLCKEVA